MTGLVAGRELDALVAEKVMGWAFHPERDPMFQWEAPSPHGHWHPYRFEPSPYSSDIAAAWDVVEKMQADGWYVSVETPPAPRRPSCEVFKLAPHSASDVRDVRTYLRRPDDIDVFEFCEYAATAPLAICLAALNAVEAGDPGRGTETGLSSHENHTPLPTD